MVNIDKELLEFCKESKTYNEIVSLHIKLKRSESTIKKHIAKLRDREYLIKDKLTKEYQTNPHIDNLNDNLKRQIIAGKERDLNFSGLKRKIYKALVGNMKYPGTIEPCLIEPCQTEIRLPHCLADINFNFSEQQKNKIFDKTLELLDVAIFSNISMYEYLKIPNDYNFEISISLFDNGLVDYNIDRFKQTIESIKLHNPEVADHMVDYERKAVISRRGFFDLFKEYHKEMIKKELEKK